MPVLRRRTAATLVYGLAYLVVFSPMALYYFRHQGIFTNRYKNISLLQQMGIGSGAIDWRPLWNNLASYALMLNYSGNEVSRHCLPFQPVVNVACGTLFALGMVFLLRHWWRPANVFCLLWVCMPLLGGAITVSETPSPYRTIVAAPAVALVMLIPLYYTLLWIAHREWWPGRWRLRVGFLVAVGGFLSLSGGWDVYTYWTQLRVVPELYRHYNYAEYVVAQRVHSIATEQPIYLYPHYYTFSSVRLLNWDRANLNLFVPSEHMPMLQPDNVPTHVFIPLFSQDLIAAFRMFHPQVQVTERHVAEVPGEGHYEIVIPAGDLEASRGLWVIAGSAVRRKTRTFEAPAGSARNLQEVTWQAVLDAPQIGAYHFAVRSTRPLGDRCRLTVAGQALPGADEAVNLLPGRAELRLSLHGMKPDERIDVLWRRPQGDWETIPMNRLYALASAASFGLRGAYYDSTTPSGPPFTERIDLFLSANESIPSPHSVRWTGFLNISQEGTYAFTIRADDGARLSLDDALLIDKWEAGDTVVGTARVPMRRGPHPIRVDYFDQGGGRIFELTWETPDGKHGGVPFDMLSHDEPPVSLVPFREAPPP
jgi:hypothetical protein